MSKGANSSYFGNIKESISSLVVGMQLTFRHLRKAHKRMPNIGIADPDYFNHTEGIFTNRYPHEPMPVPDNGRYQLHNEIDDCIVCDKCAKVCPVDCIEIEPVRAVEEIGKTSDGTTKRIHAAKFDIDMSKCCFCGLCTTVCPTECLTMTKTYDFSSFDIKEHNFAFSEMTPLEILEVKQQLAAAQEAKEAKTTASTSSQAKPMIKPKTESSTDTAAKPVFRPKMKPMGSASEQKPVEEGKQETPKPVFKPKIKPVVKPQDKEEEPKARSEDKPKPVFKPRPMIPKKKGGVDDTD